MVELSLVCSYFSKLLFLMYIVTISVSLCFFMLLVQLSVLLLFTLAYMNMSALVKTGRALFALLLILRNVHARPVPWRSYSYVVIISARGVSEPVGLPPLLQRQPRHARRQLTHASHATRPQHSRNFSHANIYYLPTSRPHIASFPRSKPSYSQTQILKHIPSL